MTILQTGPYPLDSSLIKGGVEASVFGLVSEQSKTSKVIVIDVPRLGGSDAIEEDDAVTVYRFRNPGPHQKDAVRRVDDIARLILEIAPSVCHIHGTGAFSYALVRSLRSHSTPIILTVHGLATVEKKNALKKHFSLKALYQYLYQSRCERRLLSSQKEVIVDTEYVARTIRGFKLRSTPVMTVIPQGIDERFYRLNCSADSRTILSVGSISRRKGHLQLIQAFGIAAEKLKDIRLVICGVLTDRGYYDELRGCIDSMPCKDRIALLADVSKDFLFQQYEKSHIFALHSQEESQGIVFAEAMAVGLPVVSTRVGGIPDVISDGHTGHLSDYGDIQPFASSMISLMSDTREWNGMSVKCKEKAEDYSWQRIAESIDTVYSRL